MNNPGTSDIEVRLADALDDLDGLRLAPPARSATAGLLGPAGERYWNALAITATPATTDTPAEVEIHLAATTLPLAPLLETAAVRAHDILDGTAWGDAVLALIVDDLDPAAFVHDQ